MKLKELAIDGLGTRRDLQLGRFGDGLTIIYGENGAGKSTVCQFVRRTLLNVLQENQLPFDNLTGKITVERGLDTYQLSREHRTGSTVDVRHIADSSRPASNNHVNSVDQLTGSLNQELYETVFCASFRETPNNAIRLANVLHNQLGVPGGPESAGEESAHLQWQRESKLQHEQLESLRTRIDLLTVERNGYVSQMEVAESSRQRQFDDINRQINQVVARLDELRKFSLAEQLGDVEREIVQTCTLIDKLQTQTGIHVPNANQALHATLYLRLDEIDNQIRRWRHVQSDIQNQRVRLRDEMLVWNELTLDSDEHPYHNARAILVTLEGKVDEAERSANHWGDAAAARVDTSQMARTLGELCQSMRDDLNGLCIELAQQYKHIRHKSAAGELRQLRRCYSDMGDNIKRLLQQRDQLVHEIREIDPAGADAIVRAENRFCQCAQQSGYLEARLRFVGKIPLPVANQTIHQQSSTLQSERTRLQTLEQRRNELNKSLGEAEIERNELDSHHAALIRQRDATSQTSEYQELSRQVTQIEDQLATLNNQYSELRRKTELNVGYLATQPNPLIQTACRLLNRMSNGDLKQVFLSEPAASPVGRAVVELQVRDTFGKVLNFSALDPGLQDQVYLCLIMAAKDQLQQNHVQGPTLVDDAFYRIPSERITSTLLVLNEFASQGHHQFVALTQHRYLADRVPDVPLIELPPTMPSIQPASNPDRRSTTAPVIVPMPEPNWNPDAALDHSHRTVNSMPWRSALPRPYPLSKYSRSRPDHTILDHDDALKYPEPVLSTYRSWDYADRETSATSIPSDQRVSSVSVNSIGDRLGYASGIDQATRLDQVGFFNSNQLRTFYANGIESVQHLFELDSEQSGLMGLHPDQVDRWQSQLWLLINLPGLRINDARVLVACGLTSPEQIDTSHPQQILDRVERFYATSEGRRFAGQHDAISLDRVNGWYRALDATRANWKNRHAPGTHYRAIGCGKQNLGPADGQIERPTADLPNQPLAQVYQPPGQNDDPLSSPAKPAREPRLARPPRMNTDRPERKVVPRVAPIGQSVAGKNTPSKSAKKQLGVGGRKLKFHLDLNDHIEAAPSIGPKTAERFEKIGISTVEEFLKHTAESMETKIDYKRISANAIRTWQHQARLVCRIPNLRGHDAQLLVAVGITEPEELSTMQPQKLFEIIGPFSETKEGMKIIRNGKKPDLAEVTDWISWAERMRSLQAA